MARKITEITLNDEQDGPDTRSLVAKIDEGGNLVLEGHDLGPKVKEFWPDDEYEYWRTVSAEYKDTLLLKLIQDRFTSDGEFSEWLDKKKIPNTFANWV